MVGTVALALVISVCLAYLFERTDIPGRRFLAPSTLAPWPYRPPSWRWPGSWRPTRQRPDRARRRAHPRVHDRHLLAARHDPGGGHLRRTGHVHHARADLRPPQRRVRGGGGHLGAGWATRTRKVVLPLTLPGISAASMLLVVIALEEFAIPAMLGTPDQIYVFSSYVQAALQPRRGCPTTAGPAPTASCWCCCRS
ncbi:hypothetical protein NKH77_05370 [Streptomyces sp. M19]